MFKKRSSVGGLAKKPIVTVDPYLDKYYIYENNRFSVASKKNLANENFFISYLQQKDVIVGNVEVPRGIPEDDLADAIEVKAYEELGLDSSIEYEIFHFETIQQDGKNRVFNVFAVDKAKVLETFSSVKHVKYIDYITLAPFLYKSLYKKGLIEVGGVDCFIYFHHDDATVTIYQDGEYLFSKSIRYSLKNISDTFSKELGKRVDEKEFYQMLQTSGLQNSNPLYQRHIMKLFGDIFVYINDVITFAKRSYGLSTINNLYISSEIGDIKGIAEFCHSYVNIPTKILEINIYKNSDNIEINPLYSLLTLSAQNYMDNPEDINLTIFKRPLPFKERPSGKLSMAIAAGLALGLAYPAYQFGENELIWKKKMHEVEEKYQKASAKERRMKAAFAKLNKEQKEIDKKLSQKSKKLDFVTKLLHEIYEKKVSYPMKAKVMTDIFDRVTKHRSKVVSVDNNATDLIVTVRSDSDKDITELLSELASYKKYDVSSKSIKKDNNATYYESAIKVGLHVR